MRTRAKGAKLSSAIAENLGVGIVTGVHPTGQPIPVEAELCQHYDASRTAVREAVKMLTAKGLLEVRPRLGAKVRPEREWNLLDPDVLRWLLERTFSFPLLIEFTELRLTVEPGAAALASRRATPEHRAALRRAVDNMFAAERGEFDPLESDIDFHLAVLNACNNRFYIELRTMIETALRFSIRQTHDYKGLMTTALDHKRIADAILAGEADHASAAMRALIQEALNLIREAERRSAAELEPPGRVEAIPAQRALEGSKDASSAGL